MKASFVFGDDGLRLTGEVVKRNKKTVWVNFTLPEDLGGKRLLLKRHIVKNQVKFEPDEG